MTAPNEITSAQLLHLSHTPEDLVIIDISNDSGRQYDRSPSSGAYRHPHSDLAALITRLHGRPCVITCQQGLKLSQDLVALVIRAADTNQHALTPEAAGLLAPSVGLSRQYYDDQAQLAAGLALYDALYRWACDGVDEGHDWPEARKQ